MSDLLAIEEAPNNITIWAWIETDEGKWFWSLAEKNGDDWVGVTAWDEHSNHNSFYDYGWKVLGWKKLEQPEAPQAG